MHPIEQWLLQPTTDYIAGLKLYDTYSSTARYPHLRRTLGHGDSAYNRQALREELTWLLSQLPVVATPEPPTSATTQTASPTLSETSATALQPPVVQHGEVPEQIASIEQERKDLYAEAASLHATLPHLATDQERYEAAAKILDNLDQVDLAWSQLDSYKQTGQLPVATVVESKPAPLPTDRAKLARLLGNLRSRISKQKSNPNRQTDVAAWEKEALEIEKLLKNGEKA